MLVEISDCLKEAQSVLEDFLSEGANLEKIEYAVKKLAWSLTNGRKAISCGNGGSMCDAMHFAEELTARFKSNRASLPALAISDPGYLSCTANDFGYDQVFSRFVEGVGCQGDFLLGISTSGNSKNIIRAAKAAKDKGIFTCCLLGKNGGELKNFCDLPIIVDTNKTERIQEVHIKVIHILIEFTEKVLFESGFLSLPEESR